MVRASALATVASATLAAALGWACGGPEAFACEEDAQCVQGADVGRCEAVGYCSFPDATCPSMQRFGDRAPSGVADQCTALPADSEDDGGPASGASSSAGDDVPDPDGGGSTGTSMPIDPGTTTGTPPGTSGSSVTTGSSSAADDLGESSSTTGVSMGGSESTGPVPVVCVPSLVDDFEDGMLDPAWGTWEHPGCSLQEADGRISFTVGATLDGEWVSAGLYTEPGPLQGGYVRAEVTPFVAPLADVGVWLSAYDEQGCELQITAEDGVVHGMADGVWFDGVPIAIDEPLWLQLRLDTDGVAYWEWSSDGTSWNLAHSEPCPCDAMALRSAIFAGDDHDLPTAITRSFESFERCDP